MEDFTLAIKEHPSYRAYGNRRKIKKGVLVNNEPYLLKIECDGENNYSSDNILSEYIASKIFSMFLPTQEVILGKINDEGKEKLCVACKDFKGENEYLYEFLSIKNSVLVDGSSNGSGTDLKELVKAIEDQEFCNPIELKKRFWDMFVLDAFLGNPSRDNSNWGILVNDNTQERKIAPVYSCGDCFQSDSSTFSAIKIDGKKINYYDFLTEIDDEDCLNSVKELVPKIEDKLKEISDLIRGIEILSEESKNFYFNFLETRFENIIYLWEEKVW